MDAIIMKLIKFTDPSGDKDVNSCQYYFGVNNDDCEIEKDKEDKEDKELFLD